MSTAERTAYLEEALRHQDFIWDLLANTDFADIAHVRTQIYMLSPREHIAAALCEGFQAPEPPPDVLGADLVEWPKPYDCTRCSQNFYLHPPRFLEPGQTLVDKKPFAPRK